MTNNNIKAKLFLISGALCSCFAFVIAFLLDTPVTKDMITERNIKQVAAVANTNRIDGSLINEKGDSAIGVLSSDELMKMLGHIPTGREMVADLEKKKVTVFDGPAIIAEYPILSVGKPGTFWETPAGDYSVKTKEEKHLSSIGGTWMPYSMQFYGNFFIHGWPTYKDGTDVPKGYSGGCIRLSTPDSKELYSLASVGMHIHVRGGNVKEDITNSSFYMKNIDTPPKINATSFAVFDVENEKMLWSGNKDTPISPDKLTAFMTSLVSVETIDQYKYVNFEALSEGRNPGGANKADPSSVEIRALLYPLLFDGSDVAAKAIVEMRGKRVFKNYMNEKSLAIGMNSTTWGGGTSLDQSTTTARDLAKLLSYLNNQKSYLVRTSMAETRSFELNGIKRFSWTNKNDWIKDATFQGGIVSRGKGSDGSAMAIYTLPVSEFGTRKIGFVVIGASDIDKELAKIKDYASSHFFYGTESLASAQNNKETDLNSKAVQLRPVDGKLVN